MQQSLYLASKNNHDVLVIKSLLGIVGHRASTNWTPVDEGLSADVVILDVDDNEYPNVSALKKDTGCKLVVSYSFTNQKIPNVDFQLSKPVRARDLLILLNDLENVLGSQVHLPTTMAGLSSPKTDRVQTQPDNEKVKILDELLALTQQYKAAILEVRIGNQVCYLDNYRKKSFLSHDFLTPNLLNGQIKARVVDTVPQGALESLLFTDLFYELTLQQPPARLAKGLSVEGEFHIKQWPNMSNSKNAKSMIRIAAYFSKQTATLAKAARDLSIEINQIIGFINAVHSQNLLVYSAASPIAMSVDNRQISVQPQSVAESIEVPKPKSGIGGLFGRIRQKLGM